MNKALFESLAATIRREQYFPPSDAYREIGKEEILAALRRVAAEARP